MIGSESWFQLSPYMYAYIIVNITDFVEYHFHDRVVCSSFTPQNIIHHLRLYMSTLIFSNLDIRKLFLNPAL